MNFIEKIFQSHKKAEQKEKDNFQVEVDLNFFRHGQKEKDSQKKNEDLMLNSVGREQSFLKGQELQPNVDRAVAFGGPKLRTQETSAHIMLAKTNIDQDASLEEMKEEIAKHLKVGKKIVEDNRLDFNLDGPIGPQATAAYKAGRYLDFLVHESDDLAKELKDKVSSGVYSRHAGNIAEIINKYAKVANNFYNLRQEQQLLEKETEAKANNLQNKIERYLATHNGILESFIAKVLEKIKGVEARDEFVKNNPKGFANIEGIDVKIVKGNNNEEIILTYVDNSETKILELNEKLLQEIIQDRDNLDQSII